ncbi:zinc-dependent dehydrogenase [Anaerotalea alkaliphila]|uniref:Alcohol dehydrogenase catalytic domain-containing protein n=1 Tax=Anaerotalea alkaliphila TaxID=2662126 RepID=A0A7X5HVS5_9FIRM|nr:zinc-dependent dehydrogenase [Anaerotalea alkaliphila]NDL67565.1 alcohol dehydrogenase catalytic domain-containing protein [Anaerotalea alkaliphila]
MKALVLNGPNDFSVKEVDKPVITEDEMLIKVESAALCGTDIRILEGKKTKGVRYPSTIGHEICGSITETGGNVDGFAVGDRVAIANVIPCGACASCLNGRENACLNRKAIGYEFDGGFAEYTRIPDICIQAGNVVKLPETVSSTEGALIEPLACCIRGMVNAGTKFNDTVLVVGAGPIGLMHLQLSQIAGASKVIVSEPNEYRRTKAMELGADRVVNPLEEDLASIVAQETGKQGVDVIMLAIGVPAIINDLLKLCKRGGALCLFAGFSGKGEATIEANLIHYEEINVCGSTAYKRSDYLAAAEMVKTGKIDLNAIASHHFPLDEFQAAYECSRSGEGLKVVIQP